MIINKYKNGGGGGSMSGGSADYATTAGQAYKSELLEGVSAFPESAETGDVVAIKEVAPTRGKKSAGIETGVYQYNGEDWDKLAAGSGSQGPQGPQGADGQEGAQGPQGADGQTGPQGYQGEVGPQGAEGAQGPQGPSGSGGEGGDVYILKSSSFAPRGLSNGDVYSINNGSGVTDAFIYDVDPDETIAYWTSGDNTELGVDSMNFHFSNTSDSWGFPAWENETVGEYVNGLTSEDDIIKVVNDDESGCWVLQAYGIINLEDIDPEEYDPVGETFAYFADPNDEGKEYTMRIQSYTYSDGDVDIEFCMYVAYEDPNTNEWVEEPMDWDGNLVTLNNFIKAGENRTARLARENNVKVLKSSNTAPEGLEIGDTYAMGGSVSAVFGKWAETVDYPNMYEFIFDPESYGEAQISAVAEVPFIVLSFVADVDGGEFEFFAELSYDSMMGEWHYDFNGTTTVLDKAAGSDISHTDTITVLGNSDVDYINVSLTNDEENGYFRLNVYAEKDQVSDYVPYDYTFNDRGEGTMPMNVYQIDKGEVAIVTPSINGITSNEGETYYFGNHMHFFITDCPEEKTMIADMNWNSNMFYIFVGKEYGQNMVYGYLSDDPSGAPKFGIIDGDSYTGLTLGNLGGTWDIDFTDGVFTIKGTEEVTFGQLATLYKEGLVPYKLIKEADFETMLKSISGYDESKVQYLTHNQGTLIWMDDPNAL